MNKLILVVGIALAAVFCAGALLASRSLPPPIVEARATAESAKAEQELAKADAARAAAASAWAKAAEDETHARAVAAAEDDIRGGIGLLAWGVPVLLLCALAVGALAFGRWALTQANVIRPVNGELPLVWVGGQLLDPARSLGGVVGAGEFSEAALLQIAQNAAAAGVMVSAVRADAKSGAPLADKIKGAATGLAGLMPVPTFGAVVQPSPAASQEAGAHFVFVRGGRPEAQKDLDDIREFMTQGATVRGFTRKAWLPFKFTSGRDCTRAKYDALCEQLLKAKVLEDTTKGRALACSLADALAAFGLKG